MDNKNNVILTEDGQRLTIENGEITGTADSGPGLGYETGNTIFNDGNNESKSEGGKEDACDMEEKK